MPPVDYAKAKMACRGSAGLPPDGVDPSESASRHVLPRSTFFKKKGSGGAHGQRDAVAGEPCAAIFHRCTGGIDIDADRAQNRGTGLQA